MCFDDTLSFEFPGTLLNSEITGFTGAKMVYLLPVCLYLDRVGVLMHSIAEVGTAERAMTKFDIDKEKMLSGLRGDHADEKYTRKHSAGEINMARLSPISTNRSTEHRTLTPSLTQTNTNR